MAERTTIGISRAEAARIAAEAHAEYQKLVDACNRITDRDIEEYELQKMLERRRERGPNG